MIQQFHYRIFTEKIPAPPSMFTVVFITAKIWKHEVSTDG